MVGDRAAQCNTDDIEDIREKMRVETGLVIVGGADDKLRMTTRKRKSENVTQSMVDRSIIDQIKNFLSAVLIKQQNAERGISFYTEYRCYQTQIVVLFFSEKCSSNYFAFIIIVFCNLTSTCSHFRNRVICTSCRSEYQ